MLSVIKPENVKPEGKPVEIPDTLIIASSQMNSDDKNLEDELAGINGVTPEALSEIKMILERERDAFAEESHKRLAAAQKKAEKLLSDARAESESIISEAQSRRENILDETRIECERLRKQAEEEGFAQGARQKAEEIDSLMQKLSDDVAQIREGQLEQTDKLREELKYFAVDIAESVVYRNIDRDDEFLEKLVREALSAVKGAEYITVELSSELAGIAEKLKSEEKNAAFKSNLSGKGRVVVTTPESIIDASVPEQLANIKKYFESYGDENND